MIFSYDSGKLMSGLSTEFERDFFSIEIFENIEWSK